jgi:hypothetical protein
MPRWVIPKGHTSLGVRSGRYPPERITQRYVTRPLVRAHKLWLWALAELVPITKRSVVGTGFASDQTEAYACGPRSASHIV